MKEKQGARPRLVVKVGTGVLTHSDGRLNEAILVRLVTALAEVIESGWACVLVSSGAVGAGVGLLGLDAYPREISQKQACAAVGQAQLMSLYGSLLGRFELRLAQLLLTSQNFTDARQCANLVSVLDELLANPEVVVVVNENDAVAVEELAFGDNDRLSLRVSELIGARRLVLFTTVDGLLAEQGKGQLIKSVTAVSEVIAHVSEARGKFSMGGMKQKLQMIEDATRRGIEVVIANGNRPQALPELAEGRGRGTHFRGA